MLPRFFLALVMCLLTAQLASAKTNTVRVSWYGLKDGSGPRTANNKPFSPYTIGAAHLSLPFGTKVKFTNPRNKTSVCVPITDRGPYKKGREYDVTFKVASILGIVREGVALLDVDEGC